MEQYSCLWIRIGELFACEATHRGDRRVVTPQMGGIGNGRRRRLSCLMCASRLEFAPTETATAEVLRIISNSRPGYSDEFRSMRCADIVAKRDSRQADDRSERGTSRLSRLPNVWNRARRQACRKLGAAAHSEDT